MTENKPAENKPRISRRQALVYGSIGVAGIAGIGALKLAGGGESDAASDYPKKPITLYSGYEPGGSTDVMGRGVVEYATKQLGQPTKLEFMPGAGGVTVAKYIVDQPADGYKWYIRPHLDFEMILLQHKKMPVRFEDFTTIGMSGVGEYFIVVPKKSPFANIEELIAHAKKNPGKVSYGSSGAGSAAHVASALLGEEAGAKMTHVPFAGGGPALEAVLGGHVDFLMATMPRIKDHIVDGGRLRNLVCCGKKRSPDLPDLKTLIELGYDVDLDLRHTICVSAKTPKEVVGKLRDSMKKAVDTPKYAKLIEKTGYRAEWFDHEQYATWSEASVKKYRPVMDRLGLVK